MALAPDRPWEHYYLAANLVERGDGKRALPHLQQASHYAGGDMRIHFGVAKIYEELGQCQAAVGEYEKVVSIDPDNVRAQQQLELLREGPCD